MKRLNDRNWFKGDTHMHTTYSHDGHWTKGQLVEKCKNKGLDFMIITDHNVNSVEKSYFDGEMLVIQGQELTDEAGHVNVWGKRVPFDPPYQLNTAEDYEKIIEACKKAGAVVSANHPFCSNCPFRLRLEDYPFDCIEVWNTIQHSDNMKNRDWWVKQLLSGKKIAAVGGSDYHKDEAGIPLLAMPATVVHSKSNTESDILEALVQGRSVITNSPEASMIYLTCGGANVGDTVSLSENRRADLKITKLKKGHTVRIFNNEKVIFEYKAGSYTEVFKASACIEETGFVRCEITYRYPYVLERLYKVVENKILNGQGGDVPDFIWAFTNPVWIKD